MLRKIAAGMSIAALCLVAGCSGSESGSGNGGAGAGNTNQNEQPPVSGESAPKLDGGSGGLGLDP